MKQYLKITFFNQTLKRKKNWTGNFEKLSPSKINFCPILIFSKAVCNVKSKGSDFQNWLLISHDVVLPAQCAYTTLVFWVFNLFSEVLKLDLLVAWCSYPYLVLWNICNSDGSGSTQNGFLELEVQWNMKKSSNMANFLSKNEEKPCWTSL